MSQYLFPKYGEEFIFPVGLFLSGDLVATPTISAGDFTVSKDFGNYANLTTLPTVTPAGSGQVKVTLSATEMQAANLTVKWHDPDGTWDDALAIIQTTPDDVATEAAVAAVLAMLDDARAEPAQGTPPANADLATKIDYLYMVLRNKKTETSALQTIYADDGTTPVVKRTLASDGTTLTVGEMSTGA